MTTLKVHNIETAPEESKGLLEQSQKSNGMIPNVAYMNPIPFYFFLPTNLITEPFPL